MGLHLGGWQRLGIIVSVGWVLGVLGTRMNDQRKAYSMFREGYAACRKYSQEIDPRKGEWSAWCNEQALKTYRGQVVDWKNAALVALVPLPFGWLLAYLLPALWRWVKHGFNLSRNP